MRLFTSSLVFSTAGLATCALLACGSPARTGGGETPEPGQNASTEACRNQIAAKLEEVRAAGLTAEGWSFHDAPGMAEPTLTERQTPTTYRQYDGKYRIADPARHPGCSIDNLYYDASNTATGPGRTPDIDSNNDGKWTADAAPLGVRNTAQNFARGDLARIPGYPCAAKEYQTVDEDKTKPIIILVQGNSTRPHTWESYLLPTGTPANTAIEKVQFTPDAKERAQLAERLTAEHYHVIAVDFRTDLVTSVDPVNDAVTDNAAGNIDHGWATPILQSLVRAVMKNNPGRKVALIGHSLGVSVARDAVRRLYVEYADGKEGAVNPFPQLSHVILGSGANHGVSTYEAGLCQKNATMRGTIVCEMGSRGNYVQTEFHKPLNGPLDLYATPCADGDYAFGKTGQCGGNVVKYLTITMTDVETNKNYQDYYVSEAASRINMPGCVENKLTTLNDYDTSGYFGKGFIANHFGSMRSEAGLKLTMDFLAK